MTANSCGRLTSLESGPLMTDSPSALGTSTHMIQIIESGRYFHITGTTRTEIDESLTQAVAMAQSKAEESGRKGILVTRHSHDLYTVRVSADVPYGLTVESDG